MNNRHFIASGFLLFLILASYGTLRAQDVNQKYIINNDTVYSGHYYYLETKDHEIFTCRLISANKESVLILCEEETKTIKINDIAGIRSGVNAEWVNERVTQANRSVFFFAGAGLCFPTNIRGYESDLFRAGLSFNTGVFIITGKYTCFRVEFDYWHAGRKDYVSGPYTETGGQVDAFTIKAGFAGGEFHLKEFNYHFMITGGIGLAYKKTRHVVEPSYSYDFGGGQAMIFSAGLGVNLNIPVSPKIRVFAEPQINFTITTDMAVPNYFALRAGIIF